MILIVKRNDGSVYGVKIKEFDYNRDFRVLEYSGENGPAKTKNFIYFNIFSHGQKIFFIDFTADYEQPHRF